MSGAFRRSKDVMLESSTLQGGTDHLSDVTEFCEMKRKKDLLHTMTLILTPWCRDFSKSPIKLAVVYVVVAFMSWSFFIFPFSPAMRSVFYTYTVGGHIHWLLRNQPTAVLSTDLWGVRDSMSFLHSMTIVLLSKDNTAHFVVDYLI